MLDIARSVYVGTVPCIALTLFTISGLGGGGASAASPQAPSRTAADNYKMFCASCHMPNGTHFLPEMSFSDGTWKHGSSEKEIRNTITKGVDGTAMKPFADRLSESEILDLAKHVRAFDKNLKPETDDASPDEPVSPDPARPPQE
jgi:mono/diheme cytochrome c family protein